MSHLPIQMQSQRNSITTQEGASTESLENSTSGLKYYEIPVTFIQAGDQGVTKPKKKSVSEDVSDFYSNLIGIPSTSEECTKQESTWCDVCSMNILSERYEEHIRGTGHLVARPNLAPTPDPIFLNEKNIGYMMLKDSGWEYEDGLGKNKSGRRHPLPTKLKLDKLGLGHKYKKKYVHEQQDIYEAEQRKKLDRRKTRKEIVEEHERERRKRMAMIAYMNR
ncbi:hypothetical protein K493DRAFT_332663 [Basidiobolus meristosporus CBS 931.73]|uniref:G-patch domain-containing protein n=1 Tax=Basidiobolus meristosporus CBS 931.73 TaxID=1314790 RepID=A0A1Y1ZBW0_9FUNG|nr:hypothetical protein K493DRAFT_332663 [Basidiobolus meristosporus CBS 931.73]|eukprot:ORY07758.1 hypothetical protein K493DRAFT_332663 [Basidiobolus meristosporus CBS 931.73]